MERHAMAVITWTTQRNGSSHMCTSTAAMEPHSLSQHARRAATLEASNIRSHTDSKWIHVQSWPILDGVHHHAPQATATPARQEGVCPAETPCPQACRVSDTKLTFYHCWQGLRRLTVLMHTTCCDTLSECCAPGLRRVGSRSDWAVCFMADPGESLYRPWSACYSWQWPTLSALH
jgi:hypothetical protein